jgi:U3 small nucleolar RNA-associated protein 11
VLRARDFHKKEDAIKVLKTKAAYRNPDEFYFGMEKTRTKDGVHVGRRDEANKYTADELHLMKTQDVKYVGLKASMEAKKAEKLRATLHLIGGGGEDEEEEERGGGGYRGLFDDDGRDEGFDAMEAFAPRKKHKKHTIFVDSEREARSFDAAGHFGTDPGDDVHAKAHNRRRVSAAAAGEGAAGPAGGAGRGGADASAAAGKGLGLRRGLVRAAAAEEAAAAGAASREAAELDPRLAKRIEKKRRVAYQLLKEREERAAWLKAMTAEMAMQKEISHSKGHKMKLKKAQEELEDTPEGLRHLVKAAPVFKWKKERKR